MREIEVYKEVMRTIDEYNERRIDVVTTGEEQCRISVWQCFPHMPKPAHELYQGFSEIYLAAARHIMDTPDGLRITISASLMGKNTVLEVEALVSVKDLTLLRRHARTLNRVFTNYKSQMEAI